MSFKCYFGRPHKRQAEEIAARILARDIRRCLAPDEWARLAFNVPLWDTRQADVLLMTPYAVVVGDWKDLLGRVTGGEHGPWLHDGQPMLAGATTNENPYEQILNIRRSVSAFMRKTANLYLDGAGQRFDPKTYKQVAAAIIFTPAAVEHDIKLPSETRSWLVITGLDVAASDLMARRSPLRLGPEEAEALIQKGWRCQRWEALEAVLPELTLGTFWHARANATREAHLVTNNFWIGSGQGSHWVLSSPDTRELGLVSRQHLLVQIAGDEVVVFDRSTNGTYLDDRSLAARQPLSKADRAAFVPGSSLGRLQPGQPLVLRTGDALSLGGPAAKPGTARLEFVTGRPTGRNDPTAKATQVHPERPG